MAIAIKAENISKQYRLGYVGSGSLKDDARRWWARMRGKEDPLLTIGETNDRSTKGESDYVWALKDINFEIEQGDTVGIIGRNGAGKSTLLKLLSKVTAPTTGNIKVKGRIASLLEVGTGFHGELTGRENIYLNGAIMGMRKHEITRKLDEIVDFAGVERYLDTPVKRYSSGMYVRLGFAVAAHLENEILIVDEVLAVGDAEFQKKCLGKLGDLSRGEGRTVLFVSHNMQSITTLTENCIILNNGGLHYSGDTSSAVDQFFKKETQQDVFYQTAPNPTAPNIVKVKVNTSNENQIHVCFEPLIVEIDLNVPSSIRGATLSFQIINSADLPVIHLWTFDAERSMCRENGFWKLKCEIPRSRLYMGDYTIKVYFTGPPGGDVYDIVEGICPFRVEMFKINRNFEFQANTCTYIEDAEWKIEKQY
jgi:lipopolysaccharide transport system ATP-binding protein